MTTLSSGRGAVVTGGGTGIGRAIAKALAESGDRVVITGRRADVIERAAAEINADLGPSRVIARPGDVTSPADVEALAAWLRETFGTVDIVVNNAGGRGEPSDGTIAGLAREWLSTYELNVVSAMIVTHAIAPLMPRPGGRIIMIGSMSSRSGGGNSSYGSAKAALNGAVLSLTAQFAPHGITANVILPGYTPDTELFGDGLPETIHNHLVSRIAVGRAGRSIDVAAAVRYLASVDAGFVTGQVLEVHGGSLPAM